MTQQYPIRLFEGQVNFVKFLKFHPCADPMPILVETFFPCLLRMAIDLYLWDAEDVAREVLRGYPKGGTGATARRGLRHSYKKQKDGKNVSRRQVKAVEFSHRPWVQQVSKYLFLVTEPLERIGFAMLFYNSVDNFFQNWTTLLVRRGYCELPALTGPLQLTAAAGPQIASAGGNPVSLHIEIQNRASWAYSATAVVLPPGTYTAIFQIDLKLSSPGTTEAIRLTLTEGTYPVGVHKEEGAASPISYDQYTTIMVSKVFGSPSFLLNEMWWEIETVGYPLALLQQRNAMITIWQNYEEISY